MKKIHFISRLFVGIVFMFSGFVKGIDPLGTAYRLEDYFIAWGAEWMMPMALIFSILLSTLEFVLGFVILFNLKPKVGAWLLLGVMLFFTGLTFYDALENPVPDCGCFGDAIKLTNWQTFYKNVVLMVPTLIIFIYRTKTRDLYRSAVSYGWAMFIAILFAGMSLYSYFYLPLIDFMDWKVGNKMYTEKTLPVKYYLTYRNIETGETQEFLSPNYPYNDSIWMAQWEFAGQRIEDPNAHPGGDLQIIDLEAVDVTEMIIQNPGYQFMLISWDLEKANQEGLIKMETFAQKSEADGHSFAVITSSLPKVIDTLSAKHNLSYTFYHADDISLKMMIRSNPGLILLHNGVVIGKWSYCRFMDYEELKGQMIDG